MQPSKRPCTVQLEEQLKLLRNERESMQKDLQEKEHVIRKMQDNVGDSTRRLAESEARLKQFHQSLTDSQKRVQGLAKEVEALQCVIASQQEELSAKDRTERGLVQKLDEAERARDNIVNDLKDLKAKFDELKVKEDNAQCQLSALEENYNVIAALRGQLAEHEDKCSAVQHSLHQQLTDERRASHRLARLLDATYGHLIKFQPSPPLLSDEELLMKIARTLPLGERNAMFIEDFWPFCEDSLFPYTWNQAYYGTYGTPMEFLLSHPETFFQRPDGAFYLLMGVRVSQPLLDVLQQYPDCFRAFNGKKLQLGRAPLPLPPRALLVMHCCTSNPPETVAIISPSRTVAMHYLR
eukprot:jgi/Botrbrau1/4370/Bobra.105_2s0016.1